MSNAKAKAIHDLICKMLRGPHIRNIAGADLPAYTYKAGLALHNLPFVLAGEQPLTVAHLRDINALDPDLAAASGNWGPWASELAEAFGLELPAPN